MKTPSEDIFKLIKSLSAQEKVYYKRRTKGNVGSKNYIEVFNIINKMKKYDEATLKKELKEKAIFDDFKNIKRRTFDSILKHLCDYHTSNSFKRIVQNIIYKASILIEKELFDAAEKELNKAEKLAQKAKNAQLLLEISDLRISYYRKEKLLTKIGDYYYSGKFDTDIENADAIVETIRLTKNSTKLATLYIGEKKDKNFVKETTKIADLIFSKDINHYSTHIGLTQYYHNQLIYDVVCNHLTEDSLNRQIQLIKYLEQESELIKYRLPEYLTANTNLTIIYSRLNKRDELNEQYNKINKFYASIPSKFKTKKIEIEFNFFFLNYIGNLVRFKKFKKAAAVWENHKKNDPEESMKTVNFIIMQGNLFIIYFSLNNFKEALKHTNNILNLKSQYKIEIQSLFRIFSLIIHYELKNYELLPYIVKQGEYFMKKHRIKKTFFREMFHFFSDTSIIDWSKETERNAFKKLLEKLHIIIKDPIGNKALDDFDIISWVESHIQNRPFVDIVKEKLN